MEDETIYYQRLNENDFGLRIRRHIYAYVYNYQ